MNLDARKLFLVDGLGALATSAVAFVIAQFSHLIGIPRGVMYILAGIAACFAAYSLTCFIVNARTPYLRVIAVANLLYCLVTVGVMLSFRSDITVLGIAYFVAEILIIVPLALYELTIAKQPANP